MSEELVKASATWMAQAIRRREVSAVELFDAHAARIAERDPRVNALVFPRLHEARAEAVAADAALARGDHLGPLHGVPFTTKEVIAVAGMPAPNGSRLFADHVSQADAVPLRRLREAGAILLGKTNVPEFCSHWDTYKRALRRHGQPARPHAQRRRLLGRRGGRAGPAR
jgi:amidase